MTRSEQDRLIALVGKLTAMTRETEWLEFKHRQGSPAEIGEYVSALSNGAALLGQQFGYMIWGVDDRSHEIVGTSFDPHSTKIGNEDLIPWLERVVEPDADVWFRAVPFQGHALVIMRVRAAATRPTRFKRRAFIRVDSYKKPLDEHPDLESRLWRVLHETTFEQETVKIDCSSAEVLSLLDWEIYFELLNVPVPTNPIAALDYFAKDGLIKKDDADRWEITALGALLFARSLVEFGSLARKQLRIIHYSGPGRVSTKGEVLFSGGYAKSLNDAVHYLNQVLPSNEVLKEALRHDMPMFPGLALRELLANTLIHQDLNARGQGPIVEVFDTRVEFTNPGAPLVDRLRLVDSPPKSRNETLAALMRRLGFCEERGSGWDKVAMEIDFNQLPAPLVETIDNNMRVKLYAHKRLAEMDSEERTRAVYLHACLRYVTDKHTNNTSVRERFGIAPKNAAMATRLLNDAVNAGLIKVYDPGAGRRHVRYVPFWAGSAAD